MFTEVEIAADHVGLSQAILSMGPRRYLGGGADGKCE
jgi:hypothetical protein